MVIIYFTQFKKNAKQALPLNGLVNGVAVNTLFGQPTFFIWKIVNHTKKERTISGALNIWFPIIF